MRRFLRWLFNFLAALSLLLWVATVVLWVRSYWIEETLSRTSTTGRGDYWVGSAGGIFYYEGLVGGPCAVGLTTEKMHEDETNDTIEYEHAAKPYVWGKIYDVGWKPDDEPVLRRFYYSRGALPFLAAPHWAIVLVAATLPLSRLCLRRRRPQGTCPRCGYDLRASPGRCPECGTPVVVTAIS